MNKIYKVVWNTVRNCYVVGSELISSKSGRHSTSNGKSSSLKVTLTVLALCGMTALGSGVAPAYAADAGTAVAGQYVAVLVNSSNNSRNNYRTFNGYSYHKERIASTGDVYWVRDGYTIKYEENKRYPDAQNANIIKAYKTDSYTANRDAGLLKSNQIMVESAGISTLTGVDLDDVSGGTYVGATNSGSTSTPSSFNYMIKDDNGTYVDAGNTNFSKRFKAATKNTDGTYSYKGEVIANDNLYVVNEQVGVFLTSSGKVYTGKVFGANNEVLMTTKSDEGTMYSYWGADTPDPNTKLADMTIGQFNQALEKVNNNSKAVAGDTIKEIKTTAKTDGGTIDLVRRGQYNSATGQYEGEYTVGNGITITSHGGTNGEDVKINFSNGTTGFDVAAGSKVEAVGTKEATTGLKINGETYNIKTGQTYTEGDNITIEGNKISATDTKLVDGKAEKKGDSYIVKDTAGNEVTLEDVASANKLTEVNNRVTENTQNIAKNTQDITNNTTNITNLGEKLKGAVMYDSTDTGFNKNSVTLGGTPYDSEKKTGGTKITNLARGTNDSDAVNFSQLSEVKDAENYVTSGSLSTTDGTITLNRLKDGPVTITGLQSYVKGLDSYVTSATLNGNMLTLARNQGLDSLTVDLGGLTDGLSSTDYRLIASATNGGKYVVKNGEVNLTVQDAQNPNHMETITISGLASAADVNESKVHYFSVYEQKNMAKLPKNYNNDGATGDRAIAIGVNASASGKFSVAIGSGQNSDGATTSGNYATAVGNGSLASGESSMALGYNAEAINAYSVAVGNESLVNGSNSMALGAYSAVGNQDSIVDSATAVGSLAHVYAEDGTALGENAEVLSKGKKGTALGTAAKVKAREGTAIGAYSSVSAEGGVAVGKGSVADRAAGMKGYAPVGEAGTSPVWKATDGAVSLGSDSSARTRQITNLAAGTENTDAVNVAQLKRARVELTNGTNTTVKSTNDQTDGHVIYSVDVSNEAIQKATDITGNNGIDVTSEDVNGVKTYKVSAKLSDNLLVNNTGNIDLASVLHVGSKITVDGNKGEITGLTNKTLDAADFATVGRAATEEQLSAMQSGLTAADKYVTSGTIDKANGTMKLTVANVSTPVSITGLTDYQVTQDSSYDAENHRLTLNLKDTMNTSNPAQSVTFDGIASTTDVAKATTAVEGGTNIASVDKTTGTNGNDVYTVNAKGTTVSTDDNFVLATTNAENNVTNYGLSLANSITIGKGENSHPIVIDGNKGEITGLTNKTLDAADFATVGRAATEEQLSAMQSGLTAADKYVTSGTIDKANGTMKLTVANVSTPVSITGLTDYQVTQDSSYDAENHRLTLNLKDTMNTSNPAQSVTFDGIASTTDVAKATTAVEGGTNIASVDKTTGTNGNDVYTVNAKGTTVSTDDNFVLATTNAENNVTNYGLSLANSITIGKGENSHPIVIDGNKGEITGLTNKTLDAADFATVGRAATEEQLSAMQSGLTAADKYVTSGTIDKANGTMKLTVANVSTPVSITGLTDYQVTQDSSYDAENHRLTLNLKDTMNTSNPAQSVTFDGIASTTDVAKATTAVEGGTNIASVDKTTGTNGNDVYTVNAKGTTVSTDDNFVLATTNAENNVTNYGLSLANSITIGKGESSHPIVIDGNKGEITGLTNKTLDAADFATVGRAATEEQLKEVNSKATAAKTTVTAGKNIAVNGTSDENGSAYTVALAEDVSLGNNAIQLKGTDGSISAKSGGAQLAFNTSGLTVSQAKNGLTNETRINGAEITVDGGIGNQTTIKGSTARIGSVLVNGGGGTATISGLTNQTTKYDGFANGSGRAATEEQLKEVAGQAGEAIATAGKGWNLTTNKGTATNIAPGGTVDFSSDDNLVISNAGADLSFSLSDNLDLTNNKDKKGSVKVGENTTLTNELLQVGKDVSLTASALNVGTSSLTTSALMVGGLTYINSSGINANDRVISNVAAGKADTDAVNVGQLKSAISGSQVSINAGLGIIVEKQGNQYTIKTNIEGVENEHGTIHVTDSDQSLVANSEMVTPAHAKRLNTLMMADMMAVTEATEPEKTTFTGPKAFIQQVSKPVTLTTDDQKSATLNDGETIYFQGDGNIETTTTLDTNRNSDTIKFALKKDIKVDSIEAKSGDQINIKSEVNMNDKKITNLANGEIAEGSTDAVNGGQLYNTNQAVIANAENINSLSHSLNKLDSRINRVGAGAAALAALHPLDFDPDNKWDFAAGYGNYAGANAVAIGTYYRPNENTMFSIGGSFGGGENMINAGVSFKLGSGGSGITTSKTVMAKKIKEQDELLKAQDAKMKEQDEKIAKLEALVAQQGEMIQQALGKK